MEEEHLEAASLCRSCLWKGLLVLLNGKGSVEVTMSRALVQSMLKTACKQSMPNISSNHIAGILHMVNYTATRTVRRTRIGSRVRPYPKPRMSPHLTHGGT